MDRGTTTTTQQPMYDRSFVPWKWHIACPGVLINIGTQKPVIISRKEKVIKEGEKMLTPDGIEVADYDGFSYDKGDEFCLKVLATAEQIPVEAIAKLNENNNVIYVNVECTPIEGIMRVKLIDNKAEIHLPKI